MPPIDPGFTGAKLIALLDGQLLALRRDDRPDIPFPDMWDLPGGGREGGETALACALRETAEEFGLVIAPGRVHYARAYDRSWNSPVPSHVFAVALTAAEVAAIRFGDEGQGWTLMDAAAFVAHPEAVPHLRDRVADYRAARG